MTKSIIYLILIFTTLSCQHNSNDDSKIISRNKPIDEILIESSENNIQELIDVIDKNLLTKVNIPDFMDSIMSQNNVKLLETLTEEFDSENNSIIYKSNTRKFELRIIDSTSNTLFYDGNKVIDFSEYEVLSSNNTEYKSENFGFNYRNRLENVKIIQVADKQFIYADIIFNCNGKGCGCQLNFIYDIKARVPFFIDNYRFPYDDYFISDFNNDGIVDLLIIGRNRDPFLEGLPIQKLSYELTWFEYIDGGFKGKKRVGSEGLFSYEFVSYSRHGDFLGTNFSLIDKN